MTEHPNEQHTAIRDALADRYGPDAADQFTDEGGRILAEAAGDDTAPEDDQS